MTVLYDGTMDLQCSFIIISLAFSTFWTQVYMSSTTEEAREVSEKIKSTYQAKHDEPLVLTLMN